MKLLTFTDGISTRIGVLDERGILDLSAAAPELPTEMVAFLRAGDTAMQLTRNALDRHEPRLCVDAVTIESPIARPPRLFSIGRNYAEHAAEVGRALPELPRINQRQSSSVHGPFAPFYLPPESKQLDYEVELAIVIGKWCRRITEAQAPEVVAGYTIVNDLSIRDWQLKSAPSAFMGKAWDTHSPMGPVIATPDEIGDPHSLRMRTFVNGEVRQDGNSADMIFNCFHLVSFLSSMFTLEPGDVISTGTPPGVAAAMPNKPWLRVGDVVRTDIENIGHMEAVVVPDERGSFIH